MPRLKYALLATSLCAAVVTPTLFGQLPLRWQIDDPVTPSAIGHALAVIDDIDGDGVRDLAIAAPRMVSSASSYSGRVDFISARDGSTLGSIAAPPIFQNGSSTAGFGVAIQALSDLDGDGRPDLLIRGHDPSLGFDGGGVFSSATGLEIPAPHCDWITQGLTPFVHLAELDDMNGDGVLEYATFAYGNTAIPNGTVDLRIHDGASGLPTSITTRNGALGSLLSVEDQDGDGFRDLVADFRDGIFSASPTFTIEVISSQSGGTLLGLAGPTRLGDSLLVSDLNGDGHEDIAATTAFPTDPGFDLVAYTLHPSPMPLLQWSDPSPNNLRLGPMTSADIDGDASPELVFVRNQDDLSYFKLPSGGSALPLGADLLANTDPYFIETIASSGDINGDGFDEIILGAGSLNFATQGRAWAMSLAGTRRYGMPSGATSDLDLRWDPVNESFGTLIAEPAPPLSAGFAIASLADGDFNFAGLQILVNSSPLAGFILEPIGFDGTGRFALPIELRQPALAGTSVFVQCIDASLLARASNALELRFSP